MKYEYDAANRLRCVRKDDANQTLVEAFTYGSTNARLSRLYGAYSETTFFCSVGGTVLADYLGDAVNFYWFRVYVYLGDSLLSTIWADDIETEATDYDHPDRLGTRTITDQSSGTSYEQAHLPFGKSLAAESSTNTGRRFTSYERSSITGLDYAINRTYDSKQGRFTQVDPIGMGSVSLSAPQTLNLYAYCGNDPINHIDPNGLFWGKLFKAIGHFFKKAWKWIVIAVVVAVIVFSMVVSHGATAGILGKLAGWIAKFGIVHSVETGGIALGTTGKVLLAIAGVGAIANTFAQAKKQTEKPPTFEEIVKRAGMQVPLSSLPDVGGITDPDTKDISINPRGNVRNGKSKFPDPYNGLSTLDASASIVIHELLHATNSIKKDGGNDAQSRKNQLKVLNACFRGVGGGK